MKRRLGHIIALTVSALVFFASCGKDKAQVIPRDELAEIYAEMLMTDQWIINTPNVRMIADTSLVYAPILARYGFDKADYRKSIDYYMNDPERFAKILKNTEDILDVRLQDLKVRKAELERREKLRKIAEKYRVDIKWDEMYPLPVIGVKIKRADSLAFALDTTWTYALTHVERKDTSYNGPEMVLPPVDTLVAESADTLKLEQQDTLVPVLELLDKKIKTPDFIMKRNGQK